MIPSFKPRRLLPAAATALTLLACLSASASADEKVRRNTAIDQFLEREAAAIAGKAEQEAAAQRLREGASGLGMREKAKAGERANTEAAPKQGGVMQRLPAGQWVEGPGFEVTYGITYEKCASKCVTNQKCVMIEFYRPEKKCNLYSSKRPTKKGGSSDVAVRS